MSCLLGCHAVTEWQQYLGILPTRPVCDVFSVLHLVQNIFFCSKTSVSHYKLAASLPPWLIDGCEPGLQRWDNVWCHTRLHFGPLVTQRTRQGRVVVTKETMRFCSWICVCVDSKPFAYLQLISLERRCASGFNLSAYKGREDLDSINSQACEQLNARVRKFSSSLSYRTLPTFKAALAFGLMCRNREVMSAWKSSS